jgi:hypothetical protein
MEPEFVTVVGGRKSAKCVRSIFEEWGVLQIGVSFVYINNEAVIAMGNSCRSTEHSCHIDIQLFDLQQWIKDKAARIGHVPGFHNPADALTQPPLYICHGHGWISLRPIGIDRAPVIIMKVMRLVYCIAS